MYISNTAPFHPPSPPGHTSLRKLSGLHLDYHTEADTDTYQRYPLLTLRSNIVNERKLPYANRQTIVDELNLDRPHREHTDVYASSISVCRVVGGGPDLIHRQPGAPRTYPTVGLIAGVLRSLAIRRAVPHPPNWSGDHAAVEVNMSNSSMSLLGSSICPAPFVEASKFPNTGGCT